MRLPTYAGTLEAYAPVGRPADAAPAAGAADPHRLRRGARGVRPDRRARPLDGPAGGGLGEHARLPALALGPGPRSRRGDGHGAARHGRRLADRQGADRAHDARGEGASDEAARRLRRRHRPARARRDPRRGRADRRLFRADGGDRGGGRPGDPDGVAGVPGDRRRRRHLRPRLRPAAASRPRRR